MQRRQRAKRQRLRKRVEKGDGNKAFKEKQHEEGKRQSFCADLSQAAGSA